jgi:hypothetical protein
MKVEPRGKAAATPANDPAQIVGRILSKVILAQAELVLTFERYGEEALHLICRPEAHLVTDPDTGQQIPHFTGMKYEIGHGAMTVLADYEELAGEAAEVLGREATGADHDPRISFFGVQFGQYGLLITMAGLTALYIKELKVEFKEPVVLQ